MRRQVLLATMAVAPIFWLAVGPAVLETNGHGAKSTLDEVEQCARDMSWQTGSIGGKLLKVTTPDATLTYTPASLGKTAVLAIAAPKGTPKGDRDAAREKGRAHNDALWQCAMTKLDATKVARDAERDADREERQERNAERAERAAAGLELLKGVMDATQPAGSPFSEEPASGGGGGGGEGFSGSCCINGAFYACPSMEAVNKCSGAFMKCQGGCGFDMDCIEKCSNSHPLDPSMCSRDSSQDATCK